MRIRIILCATALAAFACQDTQDPLLAPLDQQFAITPSPSTTETFFGPERFTRVKGAPSTETRAIDPSGFGPPFVLNIRNGDGNGRNAVSSAHVSLGGIELFGPADFNQNVTGHSVAVDLDGTTTLEVQVAGRPGGYLEISVEGEPLGTRFCPAEALAGMNAFGDLHSAIQATDPGGTVVVCDGVHFVNGASIDRPLTLVAEHPLQATLDVGFAISILSSHHGDIVVRDLNFLLRGGLGFRIGNGASAPLYDQVLVEGNTFEPSGGFAGAIRIFNTTTPGARVVVANNTFTGGAFVVTTQGTPPPVEIRGNTLSQTYGGIDVLDGPEATVEDNIITTRGGPGIRVLRVQDALVASNTLRMLQSAEGIVMVSPSGRITDNHVEGVGVVTGDPAWPSSWPVSVGIHVGFGTTLTTAVELTGNLVERAWQGLQLTQSEVTGSDNVIRDTWLGVFAEIGPFGGAYAFHRNDVTDYTTALTSFAGTPPLPGSMTCNWWGDAAGPTAVDVGITPGVYTPWATAPIANNPGVICP